MTSWKTNIRTHPYYLFSTHEKHKSCEKQGKMKYLTKMWWFRSCALALLWHNRTPTKFVTKICIFRHGIVHKYVEGIVNISSSLSIKQLLIPYIRTRGPSYLFVPLTSYTNFDQPRQSSLSYYSSISKACPHSLRTILYIPIHFGQPRELIRSVHFLNFQSPFSPSSTYIIYSIYRIQLQLRRTLGSDLDLLAMRLEALGSAVKQEEKDKRRQEEAHQQGMRSPRLWQARNELELSKNEKAVVQVKRNRGSDLVPQPSSTTPHPASLPTPTL